MYSSHSVLSVKNADLKEPLDVLADFMELAGRNYLAKDLLEKIIITPGIQVVEVYSSYGLDANESIEKKISSVLVICACRAMRHFWETAGVIVDLKDVYIDYYAGRLYCYSKDVNDVFFPSSGHREKLMPLIDQTKDYLWSMGPGNKFVNKSKVL